MRQQFFNVVRDRKKIWHIYVVKKKKNRHVKGKDL